MAITKIGPPLAGISGTVGGITYSRNKSGTFAKLWAQGSNPQTAKQMKQRSHLAKMPGLWRALTAGQKAWWDLFAALPAQEKFNSLGESYFASGYNWFCTCNVRLIRMGRATIQAIPTQARPAAPTISELRITDSGTETNLNLAAAITASTEQVPFPATNLIDGVLTDAGSWTTMAPATTGWTRATHAPAEAIKYFRVYPQPSFLTRGPANFTLDCRIVGVWTPQETIVGESWPAARWYDYFFTSTETQFQWRINTTVNQGDPAHVAYAEWEAFEGVVNASCIVFPNGEFDGLPDYDLVLKVAMGNSIGQQVCYGDFYEVKITQKPGRASVGFQSELESVYGNIQGKRSWFVQFFRQTAEGIRSAAATARVET